MSETRTCGGCAHFQPWDERRSRLMGSPAGVSEWGACAVPLPYWIDSRQNGRTLGQHDNAGDCDTYQAREENG
jgi:hypothetical protein